MLTYLKLAHNTSVGEDGGRALSHALSDNRTLTELDTRCCNVSDEAQQTIDASLTRNKQHLQPLALLDVSPPHKPAVGQSDASSFAPAGNAALASEPEPVERGFSLPAAAAASSSPAPGVVAQACHEAVPATDRTVPVQAGPAASPIASRSAAPSAPPLLSSEELSAHVASLSDMSVQLSLLQSAVGQHTSALSPLSAEHARQQAQLAALRAIHSCTSAREYYLHVRLLLTCAHTGAAAVRSGNVKSSGSFAAAAGKLTAEQLPKLIAKGLGKAAESIPLLGAGASALTALISAADRRSLNVELQRLVRLAHTPAELSAVVDTLARKLTLLQWPKLSSTTELQRTVNGSGFRAWAMKALGSFKADALYLVKENGILALRRNVHWRMWRPLSQRWPKEKSALNVRRTSSERIRARNGLRFRSSGISCREGKATKRSCLRLQSQRLLPLLLLQPRHHRRHHPRCVLCPLLRSCLLLPS
jgi:hypothetical protein